jgi:hypothetical protein
VRSIHVVAQWKRSYHCRRVGPRSAGRTGEISPLTLIDLSADQAFRLKNGLGGSPTSLEEFENRLLGPTNLQLSAFVGTITNCGCPALRVLGEGRVPQLKGGCQKCRRRVVSPELRLRDHETKSLPIRRSLVLALARPADSDGNCSSATARVTRPGRASRDCDACSAASPPASCGQTLKS